MPNKTKLVRITTVPISLAKLLEYQLQFMQQHYDVTAISADEAALQKIAEKEGIQFFSVELTRQITPLKDLKALWHLYKFLKKEKPDIVHSHTPKAGTVGMLAAKLAGVPYRLHTIAGLPLLETTGLKRKVLNIVEKITYRCATHIYPNSNGLKQIIINEKFCDSSKLEVLGNGSSNGINTTFFDSSNFTLNERNALKDNLGILPKDFVFIFVGRLVGDKGINELINAFKKLGEEHGHLKLLLVGPLESELDPLSPTTIELIEQNQNIISVGFQSDVRPYFAISNVLAFPSYREGFPNVVMQAGSMGLPAIVSNINGCNEIIVDGENGLIIPVKDANALYLAMKSLVKDNNLTLCLKDKSRAMITSRFEQQVVWDAILAEYKRLEQHHV